jgi:hypothetical protein
MSEDQKALYRSRGYVLGADIPQPQVLPLNGLLVHQVLLEFLNLFAGFKPFHPYLVYDALKPRFMAIEVEQVPDCLHCSRRGTGDSQVEMTPCLDASTETGSPDIPFDLQSNGGCMAKPIPQNPNFRRRANAGQGTRQQPVQPPPTPATPTAASSQNGHSSLQPVRVASVQPAATVPTNTPIPVQSIQQMPPPPPKKDNTLRNWFGKLRRIF